MSSSRTVTRPSRHQPIATGAATLTSRPTNDNDRQPIGYMTQRNATTGSGSHRVPHRVTVRKTAYQVGRLQEMWTLTHTPTKEQREQIAYEIALETRIVSTWFRDERSKETRARAEKQRVERGTVGPVRNTRTSTAFVSRTDAGHESDDGDEDPQQTLDRHHDEPMRQSPQRASPQARYAPYPVSVSDLNHSLNVAKKPAQRHFDQPLIGGSVPIDDPDQDQLAMDMDTESFGCPSPNAHQRQSLPAPSVSSSETSDEDELEEVQEDVIFLPRLDGRPEFSPRTPALVPSTIPSPRVIHASTSPFALPPISTLGPSSPSNFVSSPLTKPVPSPYNQPITLPTKSGGTYTFKPLPVIVGPLPRRDSTWRFNYYDKVSNVRQTFANKLYHHEDASSYRTRVEKDEESDGDSASEDGISTSTDVKSHDILKGFGGLFGGKKQLFASN